METGARVEPRWVRPNMKRRAGSARLGEGISTADLALERMAARLICCDCSACDGRRRGPRSKGRADENVVDSNPSDTALYMCGQQGGQTEHRLIMRVFDMREN